jgi:glucose PTS system EIICB or EIICBA component
VILSSLAFVASYQLDQRFLQLGRPRQPALAFTIYGVERSLIPFGLHHVWNVPFFFQAGQFLDPSTGNTVRGEMARFIAGDPTAGHMTGYLFKMWGLPGAALAITLARPSGESGKGCRHYDFGRADRIF